MAFSKEEFQKNYERFGADDLMSQFPHLYGLADVYIQRCRDGDDEPNRWMNFIKAHGLLNSCLIRTDDEDRKTEVEMKIYGLERNWYRQVGDFALDSFDKWKAMKSKHNKQLVKIREHAKKCFHETFSSIEQKIEMNDVLSEQNQMLFNTFSHNVKENSDQCTKSMIEFAKALCEDSEALVGPPPCSYTVIALGSIARGESTPYSDLEYAFLVESDKEFGYFVNLAVDTYFRISNLGETPLKYLYIEELHDNYKSSIPKEEKRWFVDKAMSGFKIDGLLPKAGNIPTGNGGETLIKTPGGLMEVYKECFKKYDSVTENEDVVGDMSDLLSSVATVHQHPKESSELLDEFLMLRLLFEEEVKEKPSVRKKRLSTLILDTKGYQFSPGTTSNLKRNLEVKTDIFRYPTLLADNLKIILGVSDCSSASDVYRWLYDQRFIGKEIHGHLQFILMTAIWIRTSAYLNSDTQWESLSFSPAYGEESEKTDRFYIPMNLFISMTCRLKPLKEGLLEFLNKYRLNPNEDSSHMVHLLFRSIVIVKEDFVVRCSLHYSSGDSNGGIKHLNRVVGRDITELSPQEFVEHIRKVPIISDEEKLLHTVQLTSHLLFYGAKYKVAERFFQWLVDTLNSKADKISDDIKSNRLRREAAVYLALKSICWLMLARHMEAYNSFLEARKAFKLCYPGTQKVADVIKEVSNDLVSENFGENEKQILWMTTISSQFIMDTVRFHRGKHTVIKRSYENLMSICSTLKFALIPLVAASFVPHLGYFYMAIAACNDLQFADYTEAEEYLNKAKAQFENRFGKVAVTIEMTSARILEATLCIRKGQYEEGKELSLRCIEMLRKLLDSYSHQALQCHLNLATIYLHIGSHRQILDELRKCEQRAASIYQEGSALHSASIQMIYAQAYYKAGSYHEAKSAGEEALRVLNSALKEETRINQHPDVADARRILAQIHVKLGHHELAREMIWQSKDGYEISFGPTNSHPNYAECFHVLAELEQADGNLPKAIEHSMKSIDLLKKKFGSASEHPVLQGYERFLGRLCELS